MARTFICGFGGAAIVALLVGVYLFGSYIRDRYIHPPIVIEITLGGKHYTISGTPEKPRVRLPSLPRLIEAQCGFLQRHGMDERFDQCKQQLIDDYQVAFGE